MVASMLRPELFQAIWRYRGFIKSSIKREFQTRYLGSALGAAWNVLNPLVQIIIWTLIFSELMRTRLPGVADDKFAYSIYLCAGQLTWSLFAEIVTRMQTVFIENANLLKKSSFPRICLPVIVIGSALTNFSIIFGLFLLFLLVSGRWPGIEVFAFIPVLSVHLLFAIGLGVFTGTLNVFFRDVGQFMGVVIAFWFWVTPIIYPLNALPEAVRPWVAANPLTPLVTAYQNIFLGRGWPDFSSLWPVVVLAVVMLVLGYGVYRRLSGEIVDEL
jgi:lipopolysaccharide transport system permease protein